MPDKLENARTVPTIENARQYSGYVCISKTKNERKHKTKDMSELYTCI